MFLSRLVEPLRLFRSTWPSALSCDSDILLQNMMSLTTSRNK